MTEDRDFYHRLKLVDHQALHRLCEKLFHLHAVTAPSLARWYSGPATHSLARFTHTYKGALDTA